MAEQTEAEAQKQGKREQTAEEKDAAARMKETQKDVLSNDEPADPAKDRSIADASLDAQMAAHGAEPTDEAKKDAAKRAGHGPLIAVHAVVHDGKAYRPGDTVPVDNDFHRAALLDARMVAEKEDADRMLDTADRARAVARAESGV